MYSSPRISRQNRGDQVVHKGLTSLGYVNSPEDTEFLSLPPISGLWSKYSSPVKQKKQSNAKEQSSSFLAMPLLQVQHKRDKRCLSAQRIPALQDSSFYAASSQNVSVSTHEDESSGSKAGEED